MLGLIKRTIKHKDMTVMVQLYKSLVRPNLEYCSSAWSPHYSKDKAMLERVQHRFTRMFPELRAMRYEDRLDVLHIWSLEERRNSADLIELFKMIHGFTDAPLSAVLQITTDSNTRGHDKELIKSHCHTDSRLYFFSARAINRWNLEQLNTRNGVSECVQRHLDDIRQKKMGSLWTRSRQNPIGC